MEAEQAMERASRSDERAALAEQHAADANKAAKGFDAKIADARREAARLTKEAEDERSARVKIEDEVAWRRLDPEQQESMGRNLESFAGMTGRLQVNGSDPEPNEFAIDIDKALQLGKWHIFEPLQMIMMGEGPVPFGTNPPPETGVIVVSTGEPRSRDAATAVVRELLALGFDAVVEGRIAQGVSTVFVTVQHRPLGPQGAAKLRAQKRNAQGPK